MAKRTLPPAEIGSLDGQITFWTARERELRRRAEADAGESRQTWAELRRLAARVQALRAGQLDKLALAQYLELVDQVCGILVAGEDRERAWDDLAKCTLTLERLKRERRQALREEQARILEALRRRLMTKEDAMAVMLRLQP